MSVSTASAWRAWLVALLVSGAVAAGAQGGTDDATTDTADAAASEADDDRVRITVEVSDDRGGGTAEVFASDVQYQPGEYLIAEGGIELRFQDLVMTADRARIDLPSNLLTAEGGVVLDEGPRRLTGDTLEYNLDQRTGRLTNGTAFVAPDYYFSGAELAKVGPRDYSITDGVFTSCSGEVPPWSIATSRAKVTIDEYARIKNARMRFKRLPVLYAPYIRWPAKTERSSGLLVPKPGYNNRRGAHIDLAWFQTLGRSADVTFMTEAYSKGHIAAGLELRYVPSETSRGTLRLFAVSEPDEAFFEDRGLNPDFTPDPSVEVRRPIFDPTRNAGDTRWKVSFLHETSKIWKHFKGVIDFQDYSDFEYLADYDRTVDRTTVPFIYSNAYLSGNIGPHSINFLVDQREFLPTQQVGFNTPGDRTDDVFERNLRRQLPEIEYRLRSTQLGSTPIYLNLLGSVNYFTIDGTAGVAQDGTTVEQDFDFRYSRADLAPTFSIPLSSLAWLSAKLSLGGRVTQYSKSLPVDATGVLLGNDDLAGSLTRSIGVGSLEIVGPSISRIFDANLGRFSKLKHIVEPRWDVNYVSDFDEEEQVLFFDEIDRVLSRYDVVFSLTNRLIAKPAPKEGEEESSEGAFEIASFSLAQGYSLDPERFGQRSVATIPDPDDPDLLIPAERSRFGPVVASFRFNPSRRTSLRLEATYNTLFNSLQSSQITGSVALSKYNEISFSWLTEHNLEPPENPPPTVNNPDRIRDQAQLGTKVALIRDKLFLDAGLRYDLKNERTQAQAWGLRWQGSCYTLQLNWQEQFFRGVRDTDLRFLFTLKNVGAFIDINGNTNSF